MKKALWALTWEFSHQFVWLRTLHVLGMGAGMVLLHKALWVTSGGYDDPAVPDRSLNLFLLLAPFVFWAVIGGPMVDRKTGGGLPPRLYTLPLPTWVLSGWLMFLCMIANAMALLAMMGLFYLGTGISLLMWGPVVFAAVIAAWGQSVLWAATGSVVLRIASFSLVFVGLTAWVSWRLFGGFSQGPSLPSPLPWTYPTPGEWLFMAGLIILALVIGWFGLTRDRRGDVPSLPIEYVGWETTLGKMSFGNKPFASPEAALFWFAWRKWGWVIPTGLVLMVGLVLSSEFEFPPTGFFRALTSLTMMALTLGAFVSGTLIANGVAFEGRKGISPFLATKPLADRTFAFTVLKSAILSSSLIWVLFVPGVVTCAWVLWRNGSLPPFESPWNRIFGESLDWIRLLTWLVYSLAVVWTSTGIGVALVLTGCGWVMTLFLIDFFGVVLVSSIAELLGLERFLEIGFRLIPWVLYVGCFGGTVTLLGVAYRRGYVGGPIASIAAFWLVCLLGIVPWFLFRGFDLNDPMSLCGLLALPVTPLAAAPLALAWNRHR